MQFLYITKMALKEKLEGSDRLLTRLVLAAFGVLLVITLFHSTNLFGFSLPDSIDGDTLYLLLFLLLVILPFLLRDTGGGGGGGKVYPGGGTPASSTPLTRAPAQAPGSATAPRVAPAPAQAPGRGQAPRYQPPARLPPAPGGGGGGGGGRRAHLPPSLQVIGLDPEVSPPFTINFRYEEGDRGAGGVRISYTIAKEGEDPAATTLYRTEPTDENGEAHSHEITSAECREGHKYDVRFWVEDRVTPQVSQFRVSAPERELAVTSPTSSQLTHHPMLPFRFRFMYTENGEAKDGSIIHYAVVPGGKTPKRQDWHKTEPTRGGSAESHELQVDFGYEDGRDYTLFYEVEGETKRQELPFTTRDVERSLELVSPKIKGARDDYRSDQTLPFEIKFKYSEGGKGKKKVPLHFKLYRRRISRSKPLLDVQMNTGRGGKLEYTIARLSKFKPGEQYNLLYWAPGRTYREIAHFKINSEGAEEPPASPAEAEQKKAASARTKRKKEQTEEEPPAPPAEAEQKKAASARTKRKKEQTEEEPPAPLPEGSMRRRPPPDEPSS